MQGHEGWDDYADYYDWENAQTVGRRDIAFWSAFAQGVSSFERVKGAKARHARAGAPILDGLWLCSVRPAATISL